MANFNLPASYPPVWTISLKIAAGVVSALSSWEWAGKWGDSMQQRSCSGFERVIPPAGVSAQRLRCVSTKQGAGPVFNRCWWMSWDGVWHKNLCTGCQTACHQWQTERRTDTGFLLCFTVMHFKPLWCRVSVVCCSCIAIYPWRCIAPLLFSENSYPVDVVVAVVVVVVMNPDNLPAQSFWSYYIKVILELYWRATAKQRLKLHYT